MQDIQWLLGREKDVRFHHEDCIHLETIKKDELSFLYSEEVWRARVHHVINVNLTYRGINCLREPFDGMD